MNRQPLSAFGLERLGNDAYENERLFMHPLKAGYTGGYNRPAVTRMPSFSSDCDSDSKASLSHDEGDWCTSVDEMPTDLRIAGAA
ncbi:hypothetical protein [Cupriavidus sp. U2]|uniref:hypothetical protein n=1 Tax=Cupriavidus sp. U2 TaxID=2920269 RepID=UPI00129E06E9|nr:hypothetical protein [Cupriavidus sp. U2]